MKLNDYENKKKGIGYKVFYLKDGKLYPPMVQNPGGKDTPIGEWIEAAEGAIASYSKTDRPQVEKGGEGTHTTKGTLAYRPGWHLGVVPIAHPFDKTNPENGKKELFPREFVWAECEYVNEINYQDEAMTAGINKNGKFQQSYAGLQRLPKDGSYRYRTNPDPKTEEWIITGAIKVNKILSPEEVDSICIANGREPQKRETSYQELFDSFNKNFIEGLARGKRVIDLNTISLKEFSREFKNQVDKLSKSDRNALHLCIMNEFKEDKIDLKNAFFNLWSNRNPTEITIIKSATAAINRDYL